jgi:hypothetical protein
LAVIAVLAVVRACNEDSGGPEPSADQARVTTSAATAVTSFRFDGVDNADPDGRTQLEVQSFEIDRVPE